jgi:hypothetical protein
MELNPKVTVKIIPKNGFDSLCKPCVHRGRICDAPCIFLLYVDGSVGRKEKLIADHLEKYEQRDYKETLTDLAGHYDPPGLSDSIMGMPNNRAKAIASLLYFKFNRLEASHLLHINPATLWRIVRRWKRK